MKRLRVLMTQHDLLPDRLAGATAVVVDVFLATTTRLTVRETVANKAVGDLVPEVRACQLTRGYRLRASATPQNLMPET